MVGEVGQICLAGAKEGSFKAVDGKHGKLLDDAQKSFTISYKTSTEYVREQEELLISATQNTAYAASPLQPLNFVAHLEPVFRKKLWIIREPQA